jgi:serine-type D-Ala-D-Ala carboxypeptidase (penicillin-binding protein 5/6)
MKRISIFFLLASLAFLAVAEVGPQEASYADAPKIQARSAILLDASTGDDLYEKNADAIIPPASLTKLMTIHLVYQGIAAGKFSLNTRVPVLAADCSPDLPYRSSLMFLQPGMAVTVGELLQGLAVASGNDAAFVMGRFIGGDLDTFARQMNAEAERLGLSHTRFVEPSGLSENNHTTARDFAAFCAFYLKAHPQAVTLHSLPSISFPQPRNFPAGMRVTPPIVQENRNLLLKSYPGCDGLKTGYIDESGYNIALSAERDGTRLVAVILGGYGQGSRQGYAFRQQNGQRILDYGFEHFKTIRPNIGPIAPLRVWKGKKNKIELVPAEEVVLTARIDELNAIQYRVECDQRIIAPVDEGEELGQIVFSANGRVIRTIALRAKTMVPKGNVLKVLLDSLRLLFG